jgi:DNA polymerase III epsilon subunit-like protein
LTLDFITVDVETGGLSPYKNPLGKTFYGECAIGEKECTEQALRVNGISVAEWKDKPSLKSTIGLFLSWVHDCEAKKIIAGHNPRFDLEFLSRAFYECNLRHPFGFRTIDMHSLAYAKFGESMSSDQIYEKLGLEPEPKPHNALNGAMCEARAFRRLMV